MKESLNQVNVPLKYLVPSLSFAEVRSMLSVAMLGGVMAGFYGALHDQITYTLSPEYFTKVKFTQFALADFQLGNRVFVATIGFLATWWLGLIVAWFLARRYLKGGCTYRSYQKVGLAFLCVFGSCAFCGVLAFAYDIWRGPNADYSAWKLVAEHYDIRDTGAFVRVAHIHNASYVGGPLGMIIALLAIQPSSDRNN